MRINPRLPDESIAANFASWPRLRIDNFLVDKDARALAEELRESSAWRHVLSAGDKVYEMTDADHRTLTEEQAGTLEQLTYRSAAERFQFRYDTIRIADREVNPAFKQLRAGAFATLMNSADTIDRIKRWTGISDLAFADCQATRYQAGDFLTRHDDEVEGKNRRLAYVLGLSERWLADWGGLLLFQDNMGTFEEAWAPAFNTLTLFAVGQPHSVGMVAPFAQAARLSMTGWIRCEAE